MRSVVAGKICFIFRSSGCHKGSDQHLLTIRLGLDPPRLRALPLSPPKRSPESSLTPPLSPMTPLPRLSSFPAAPWCNASQILASAISRRPGASLSGHSEEHPQPQAQAGAQEALFHPQSPSISPLFSSSQNDC